jgi:hypothetical protein
MNIIYDGLPGTLTIPASTTYANANYTSNGLHWVIDWGDGDICRYSADIHSIYHMYQFMIPIRHKKQYTVTISYDESSDEPMYYGWASCIRPYYTNDHPISHFKNLSHIIQVPYKSQSKSETDTGDWHMSYFAGHCPQLESCLTEDLPDSVTTIGSWFRTGQYYKDYSLQTSSNEYIPPTVTSIGLHFRSFQYAYCTNLTIALRESLPIGLTVIEDWFRFDQYNGCTSLLVGATEALPTGVTTIANHFREEQYNSCELLITPAAEVIPDTVTKIGNSFRRKQYNGTKITTAAVEVIPNSVTTVGDGF